MRLCAVVTATTVVACGGEPTEPRYVESALVASGRVLYPTGAPAGEAIVGINAMNNGKAGGDVDEHRAGPLTNPRCFFETSPELETRRATQVDPATALRAD